VKIAGREKMPIHRFHQTVNHIACWTKPLRGGKTSAIFILSLWERLSNREKSWQNATHTVSGNEPERIMRITEKNLAMCKKIA
jgi:hypothetical protein